MKVKIREVTEPNEIIKAFSRPYTDRSKVLLWQTSKSDKTKKTLIYCELVSIDQKKIYLTPFNAKMKNIVRKTIKTNNKDFLLEGPTTEFLFKKF